MLLLLLACHGPDDKVRGDDTPPTWTDADGATLTMASDGTLEHTGADGVARTLHLSFGTTAGAVETTNFDPWTLYDDPYASVPADLTFQPITSASWDGTQYRLTYAEDHHAVLTADDTGPGIRFTVAQAGGEPWAPYVRVSIDVTAAERFYGLGEVFGHAEHRGTLVPMQFEVDLDLEGSYNETHVPVPLLVSTASWGLLADSFRAGVFDVAATDPEVVAVTFTQVPSAGGGGSDDAGLTVDLYAPPSPALVTARYWQRTGLPEVPPDWAFAPFQWRNEVSGSLDVYADAAAIRANGIPTGTIWVDNPWQTTYNSMIPDPAMFPDWDTLIADLHAAGFKMMAWSTPYVETDDPDHETYDAAGWFVDAPILFSDFGDWMDLTNDDAMAAWQGRVAAARDIGIDGWKMDYAEDAQLGLGGARLVYPFDNGTDERTMHHQYATYYHRAYADPYPDTSGFILGRGGALRGHTVTDCIWPGDLDSGFERYGVDGMVGGLPSAIRAGTGLAVSGYPFFASDTGGFRNNRPTSEAMIRWTEYSATLPVMQYGGGGDNHNPWDFTDYGDSQFDEQTLTSFIRYAQLHTRLFPYFQTLVDQMLAGGPPLVLPPGLVFPALHASDPAFDPNDAFLVGTDLYVAPVEDQGATERIVTLPPGEWVHWWTGDRLAGGAPQTVAAPLGAGPLYQRAGSAIPMLRRSVVSLSPATDPAVDTWAGNPGPLNARVVPGAGAAFLLATGESLRAEDAATTQLTAGSRYSGWDLEIYAPGATGVRLDGASLGAGTADCASCWFTDGPWVRVIAVPGDHAVSVE